MTTKIWPYLVNNNDRLILENHGIYDPNYVIGKPNLNIGENFGGGMVIYTGLTTGTNIIAAYGGGGLGPLLPAPILSPPNYWFEFPDPPNSDEAKQFGRGGFNTDVLNANMAAYPSYLFPQVVNNFSLSGYSDWKVPSLYELQEINKYKVQLSIPDWTVLPVTFKVTSSLSISRNPSYLWGVRGDGYAEFNIDTADYYMTTCLIRYV